MSVPTCSAACRPDVLPRLFGGKWSGAAESSQQAPTETPPTLLTAIRGLGKSFGKAGKLADPHEGAVEEPEPHVAAGSHPRTPSESGMSQDMELDEDFAPFDERSVKSFRSGRSELSGERAKTPAEDFDARSFRSGRSDTSATSSHQSRRRAAAKSAAAPAPSPGSAALSPRSSGSPAARPAPASEAAPPATVGAAPRASDAEEKELELGDFVEIFGLLGAKELNGRKGRIVTYIKETQRFGVKLPDAVEPKALKPTNLRRIAASDSEAAEPAAQPAAQRAETESEEEEDEDEDEDEEELQIGDTVEIFGLIGAKVLNGRTGLIVTFIEATSRFGVKLADADEPKALKPDNLRKIVPPARSDPSERVHLGKAHILEEAGASAKDSQEDCQPRAASSLFPGAVRPADGVRSLFAPISAPERLASSPDRRPPPLDTATSTPDRAPEPKAGTPERAASIASTPDRLPERKASSGGLFPLTPERKLPATPEHKPSTPGLAATPERKSATPSRAPSTPERSATTPERAATTPERAPPTPEPPASALPPPVDAKTATPQAPSTPGSAQAQDTGTSAPAKLSGGLFGGGVRAAGLFGDRSGGGLFGGEPRAGGLFGGERSGGGLFGAGEQRSGGGLFSAASGGGLFGAGEQRSGGGLSSAGEQRSGGGLFSGGEQRSGGGIFGGGERAGGGIFGGGGGIFGGSAAARVEGTVKTVVAAESPTAEAKKQNPLPWPVSQMWQPQAKPATAAPAPAPAPEAEEQAPGKAPRAFDVGTPDGSERSASARNARGHGAAGGETSDSDSQVDSAALSQDLGDLHDFGVHDDRSEVSASTHNSRRPKEQRRRDADDADARSARSLRSERSATSSRKSRGHVEARPKAASRDDMISESASRSSVQDIGNLADGLGFQESRTESVRSVHTDRTGTSASSNPVRRREETARSLVERALPQDLVGGRDSKRRDDTNSERSHRSEQSSSSRRSSLRESGAVDQAERVRLEEKLTQDLGGLFGAQARSSREASDARKERSEVSERAESSAQSQGVKEEARRSSLDSALFSNLGDLFRPKATHHDEPVVKRERSERSERSEAHDDVRRQRSERSERSDAHGDVRRQRSERSERSDAHDDVRRKRSERSESSAAHDVRRHRSERSDAHDDVRRHRSERSEQSEAHDGVRRQRSDARDDAHDDARSHRSERSDRSRRSHGSTSSRDDARPRRSSEGRGSEQYAPLAADKVRSGVQAAFAKDLSDLLQPSSHARSSHDEPSVRRERSDRSERSAASSTSRASRRGSDERRASEHHQDAGAKASGDVFGLPLSARSSDRTRREGGDRSEASRSSRHDDGASERSAHTASSRSSHRRRDSGGSEATERTQGTNDEEARSLVDEALSQGLSGRGRRDADERSATSGRSSRHSARDADRHTRSERSERPDHTASSRSSHRRQGSEAVSVATSDITSGEDARSLVDHALSEELNGGRRRASTGDDRSVRSGRSGRSGVSSRRNGTAEKKRQDSPALSRGHSNASLTSALLSVRSARSGRSSLHAGQNLNDAVLREAAELHDWLKGGQPASPSPMHHKKAMDDDDDSAGSQDSAASLRSPARRGRDLSPAAAMVAAGAEIAKEEAEEKERASEKSPRVEDEEAAASPASGAESLEPAADDGFPRFISRPGSAASSRRAASPETRRRPRANSEGQESTVPEFIRDGPGAPSSETTLGVTHRAARWAIELTARIIREALDRSRRALPMIAEESMQATASLASQAQLAAAATAPVLVNVADGARHLALETSAQTRALATASAPVLVNAADGARHLALEASTQAHRLALSSAPLLTHMAEGMVSMASEASAAAAGRAKAAVEQSFRQASTCIDGAMRRSDSSSSLESEGEGGQEALPVLPPAIKAAMFPHQLPAGPLEATLRGFVPPAEGLTGTPAASPLPTAHLAAPHSYASSQMPAAYGAPPTTTLPPAASPPVPVSFLCPGSAPPTVPLVPQHFPGGRLSFGTSSSVGHPTATNISRCTSFASPTSAGYAPHVPYAQHAPGAPMVVNRSVSFPVQRPYMGATYEQHGGGAHILLRPAASFSG